MEDSGSTVTMERRGENEESDTGGPGKNRLRYSINKRTVRAVHSKQAPAEASRHVANLCDILRVRKLSRIILKDSSRRGVEIFAKRTVSKERERQRRRHDEESRRIRR